MILTNSVINAVFLYTVCLFQGLENKSMLQLQQHTEPKEIKSEILWKALALFFYAFKTAFLSFKIGDFYLLSTDEFFDTSVLLFVRWEQKCCNIRL